jgi:deoxyribodipyrimidine photolyase-related protein
MGAHRPPPTILYDILQTSGQLPGDRLEKDTMAARKDKQSTQTGTSTNSRPAREKSVLRGTLPKKVRRLVVVFGDHLASDSSALDDFDPTSDVVWMAENVGEATSIPSHKFRLVYFFSAMRHFRDALLERDMPVWYHQLSDDPSDDAGANFSELLEVACDELSPDEIVTLEPSDERVERSLKKFASDRQIPLDFRTDDYFYCSIAEFRDWAKDRKSMVLEHFYRHVRKRHGILIENEKDPEGGKWNYDHDNRGSFGKSGPPSYSPIPRFTPDALTENVIEMVNSRFESHPGTTEHFDLPVTREAATELLDDFLDHRLERFGEFQDAMWQGADEMFHSRLSAAMNLHLLDPKEIVERTIERYRADRVPIESAEGFIRQIIGWREFVRGIYWTEMPDYADGNYFDHQLDVPSFYWDGETDMQCVSDAMHLVHTKAYAHHIQRLMVLGLFSQLIGVHPYKFHQWHMAMYADAIDWVSLPNTLGMSQFGDGGVVGTKPYCASGAYINKMSNHCKKCRFDPKQSVGEKACPFTTLYWDFLNRHRSLLEDNRRMLFQIKNLERKSDSDLEAISTAADDLRSKIYAEENLIPEWALSGEPE